MTIRFMYNQDLKTNTIIPHPRYPTAKQPTKREPQPSQPGSPTRAPRHP